MSEYADTRPDNVERCECGEEALTPYTQWVAYASVCHTPTRCGLFRKMDVVSTSDFKPRIHVTWDSPVEVKA